jgi:hypothetical protein
MALVSNVRIACHDHYRHIFDIKVGDHILAWDGTSRILQTIDRLKQSSIDESNQNIRKLAMEGDMYIMKVASNSDIRIIFECFDNSSIEIADIVRYERIRKMYNNKSGSFKHEEIYSV